MCANSLPSRYEVIDEERAGSYEVQGQRATDLEWRVALALEKLKLPYMFQFSLGGGRTKRGGVILDFLVFTAPLATPLEVMGQYWHRGAYQSEDKLKEAILRNYGSFAEVVYLWQGELQTISDAHKAVKRELRV